MIVLPIMEEVSKLATQRNHWPSTPKGGGLWSWISEGGGHWPTTRDRGGL